MAPLPPRPEEVQQKRRWFSFRKKRQEPIEDTMPVATTQEMLRQAMEVQQDTYATIRRTERLVEESEQMGLDAAAKLQVSREKVHQIDATVSAMEPMTQRAKKELRVVANQLVKDKCFMTLMILVVALLITIIVVSQTTDAKVPQANGNVYAPPANVTRAPPPTPQPPTPSPPPPPTPIPPTTLVPSTQTPTTAVPTPAPTTQQPITPSPTTAEPPTTTAEPATPSPSTPSPLTPSP
jgi:hypothetical protein